MYTLIILIIVKIGHYVLHKMYYNDLVNQHMHTINKPTIKNFKNTLK